MSALKQLLRSVAIIGLSTTVGTNALYAQDDDGHSESYQLIPDVEQASKVNDNTVGLVFSTGELIDQAVQELDLEVKEHAGIRLVPVLGRNDVQNVYDLLFLKGVDAAIVRTDALEYVRRRGNFPTVGNVVNAMLAIHQDKLLVLANKNIASIDELDGKKMVVGNYASGEYITASVLADILDIEPELVFTDIPDGLQQLESGEVSAVLFHYSAQGGADKSSGAHTDLPAHSAVYGFDANSVHVLPLPVGNQNLDAVYKPAKLTPDDLPKLIADGGDVDTVSVDTVLAAYRWRSNNPRYEKSSRFVSAFIDSMDHLRESEHQEFWGELDISAPVHGMTRLAVVDEVLIERERAIEAELQERLAQIEAAKESERLAKLAKLAEQREQILDLLDQKITNASDSEELQSLLDEINEFADKLE